MTSKSDAAFADWIDTPTDETLNAYIIAITAEVVAATRSTHQ